MNTVLAKCKTDYTVLQHHIPEEMGLQGKATWHKDTEFV
jgi:hypothetical protein